MFMILLNVINGLDLDVRNPLVENSTVEDLR